ncbi:MAG: isoleucine--tRNA ligase [bacterium]
MNETARNEKKVLKFWERENIFAKSVKQRKGKKFFSFYDGPPFATGLPHYGHILATTIKDSVLRYWTMRGYQVPRRVGWDCHGLPVENLIEKELNFKSKKDIEEFGIDKFNKVCRQSVFRCTSDFIKTLRRVGRWADYSDAYATMDNEYIESVWWVFKQLWEKGLVYKDHRVTPYCPRCGTPLSNFELNQPGAYQDVQDQSAYVKFKLKDSSVIPVKTGIQLESKDIDSRFRGNNNEGSGNDNVDSGNTYLLIWTTTPWTLTANVAVAVGKKIKYVKVKTNKEYLILAESRLDVLDDEYEIIEKISGKKLIGLEYEPVYKLDYDKPAYKVVDADYVTTEDGTGLVHLAPFGEDDSVIIKKEKLPTIITVDKEGKIIMGLNLPGEGVFVKKADKDIKEDLTKRKLLYKEETITHSYPFCWRCDTPLLYYPIDSWYVAVTKFKKQLVANNKKIHWMPEYLKEGRFGKWLEGARDWSVSRNRFWGAPIPVWECDKCNEVKVVGSIKELKKDIKDIHRPMIDAVQFKCKCGGEMKRVPEVFDCWFESGSMPYAQWHYPFENKKMVEDTYPADFIAEGLDQTRGWFYTLHVLATALTLKGDKLGKNQPAFKNVIVNGLVLAEDGKKLSKRLKNYTAPDEIFEKYGADALRYFLLASTQIGEDYLFSDKRVAEVYRRTIMTLWNSFVFFDTYSDLSLRGASISERRNNLVANQTGLPRSLRSLAMTKLDKWILSRLNNTIAETTEWMNKYDLTKAVRLSDGLIDDLSNWYIRRSRRRLQKPETPEEKEQATQVFYHCLMEIIKLMSPFTPFITETIYQRLKQKGDAESVHLCDYPKANKKLIDNKLEEEMFTVRDIVNSVLKERTDKGIKVRQPLGKLTIDNKNIVEDKDLVELIKDEVNVKNIVFGKKIELDTKITPELEAEGLVRELVRFIQKMRKDGGLNPQDKIYLRYNTESSFLKNILANNLTEIAMEVGANKTEETTARKEAFLVEKETEFNSHKIWLGIRKK